MKVNKACLFYILLCTGVVGQCLAQEVGKRLHHESPCFSIQKVQIESGSEKISEGLLNSLHILEDGSHDSPIGRCVGGEGIQILIDRLQNALIKEGFVTSRALAQPQNLQTGELNINVIFGKIKKIDWSEPNEVKTQRATLWNTLPTRAGDVLNLRNIEQGIENFKRVPTAEADIQIVPANEPEYSNLLIKHQQAFPFRLTQTLDDSGTPSTGKQQTSTTLSYDNWFTLSDLFYITVNHDTGVGKQSGARGTQGSTLHYSIPLGYQSIAINHVSSNYNQTVAGFSQDYVYAGNSETTDIKLSSVVQRDASGKTTIGLKAFRRKSSNFIDDTEVEVQKRIVGGWIFEIGRKQNFQLSNAEIVLAYKQGTRDFGAIPAPEEAFNEGTAKMRIWTLDANLNTPFNFQQINFNYNANIRVQQQQTQLTPQDYFSIGGRFTVRGFDGTNTLSGDNGWLMRNELAANLGPMHKVYAGIDSGYVGGPAAANLIGHRLTGAVIGLRAQHGAFQYDFFVGAPVKAPDKFKTPKQTAGFNLSINI